MEVEKSAKSGPVVSLGAEALSAVSKNIDFVVSGNRPGSKFAKAKNLGLKIIDEEEFKRLTGL